MLGLKLEEIDQIRTQGFRPQVVGCFVCDFKILMVYKKAHDLWQLPQGGIDNHESIDQAFFRELGEELGPKFIVGSDKDLRMVGSVEAKFTIKNLRELNSDAGKKLHMRGKRYFFITTNVSEPALDISQTEFDDYKWLSHDQAVKLAQTITQTRKQKITIKGLNLLKKKGFIS